MTTSLQDDAQPIAWKKYLVAGLQFLVIFYLATLGLGLWFLHRGENWQVAGAILGLSYLLIIIFSAIRMVRKLSMAAIMVASPTIPLCMLIIVVSMLPLLQMLDKKEHLPPPSESPSTTKT
jgi:hypothetical protein